MRAVRATGAQPHWDSGLQWRLKMVTEVTNDGEVELFNHQVLLAIGGGLLPGA